MKKVLPLLVVFLFAHFYSFADGYWLEVEGSAQVKDTVYVKIRYGGVEDGYKRYIKKGALLDKMSTYQLEVVTPSGKAEAVSLKQLKDCFMGYFIPKTKGSYQIFAINDALPVVERADTLNNIKPVQYLCAEYRVGSGAKAPLPTARLYMQVDRLQDKALIRPFISGLPVKEGTSLRVFLPDNHDLQLKVDGEGMAYLPLKAKGTYLIRLDQQVSGAGEYKGKRYNSTRHRCDYTLAVN